MSLDITIVYFTGILPTQLADELGAHGINCFEALELSEVFNLCEHPEINLVVVDPSVDDQRAKIVQQRFPTLTIHAGADPKDVLWEITNLLGKASLTQ